MGGENKTFNASKFGQIVFNCSWRFDLIHGIGSGLLVFVIEDCT